MTQKERSITFALVTLWERVSILCLTSFFVVLIVFIKGDSDPNISKFSLILLFSGISWPLFQGFLMLIEPVLDIMITVQQRNQGVTKASDSPLKKPQEIIALKSLPSMDSDAIAQMQTIVNEAFSAKAKEFLTKDEFMKDYFWKALAAILAIIALLKFVK